MGRNDAGQPVRSRRRLRCDLRYRFRFFPWPAAATSGTAFDLICPHIAFTLPLGKGGNCAKQKKLFVTTPESPAGFQGLSLVAAFSGCELLGSVPAQREKKERRVMGVDEQRAAVLGTRT